MNTEVKNTELNGELTVYGKIAISVFIIGAGLSYLVPSIYPETAPYFPNGTNYISAGILIILVNIINYFKGINYDLFLILLSAALLVVGINKALMLEIKFLPVLLVILGLASLLSNVKRLKD